MVATPGNPQEDQYTQQVNIALEVDDSKFVAPFAKAQKAVEKFANTAGILKTGIDALSATLFKNNKGLLELSGNIRKAELNSIGFYKAISGAKQLGTVAEGLLKVRNEVIGLNRAMSLMAASGFDTSAVQQISVFQDAILGNAQATEQVVTSSIGLFNRYQQSLNSVKVLFDKNDEFAKNLSANVQNIVSGQLNNAVTSVQALSASYEAASAGFKDAAENQAVMVAGLKLATAGGSDAGATMRALTQTLKAYNLSANESYKVAALLNATIQEGITTMPELANGFAETAVVAKEAGVGIEDLSASVAQLTLRGASTAGALTGLESLFRIIINKTPESAKALSQLRDAQGNRIRLNAREIKSNEGLGKTLQKLNEAIGGNTELLREILPDSNAFATALSLMANNAKDLIDKTDKMKAIVSTGAKARAALDEVFGIKLEGQAASFEAVINKITEFFIKLGESFAPTLSKGIDLLGGFIDKFEALPDWIKEAIKGWLLLQLTLKSVGNVFGNVGGTIVNLAKNFIMARLAISVMNGELFKSLTIVPKLIASQQGIVPVIKQLLGYSQEYLVVNTRLGGALLDRTRKVELLKQQQAGFITVLQQQLGIDQSQKILFGNTNLTLAERAALLDDLVDRNLKNTAVQKKLVELQDRANKLESISNAITERRNTLLGKNEELTKKLEASKSALSTAIAKGNMEDKAALEESIKLLEQRIGLNQKQADDLVGDEAKAEVEAGKAAEDVRNQKKLADAERLRILKEYEDVNKKAIKAQSLSTEAAKAKTAADAAAGKAAQLRAVAENAATTSTEARTAATEAQVVADKLAARSSRISAAAELANNKAKEAATALTIQQGLAEGTLRKVRIGLNRETDYLIVRNGLLQKIFFGNVLGAKAQALSFTVLTAKMKLLAAEGFKTGLATKILTTSLTAGLNAAKAAAISLTKTFLALNPIVLVLAAGAAYLATAFFGSNKRLRDLNGELEKLNKENLKETVEIFEKTVKAVNDLNIATGQLNAGEAFEKAVQDSLDAAKKRVEAAKGDYKDIWSTIGSGAKTVGKGFFEAANLITKFTSFGIADLKKFDEALNADQKAKSTAQWGKAINATFDQLDKTNQQVKALRAGLTGVKNIDDKIRAGKALTAEEEIKLNAVQKQQLALTDQRIKANNEEIQKRIEARDKIKNKDSAAFVEETRQIQALITQNEKLEASRAKLADYQKLEQEQRQGIKAIQENYKKNAEATQQGAANLAGEGANYITRTLTSAASDAELELDNYGNALAAKLNNQSKFVQKEIDKTTGKVTEKEVDLDIEDLGAQPVEELRKRTEAALDSINDLREAGEISAQEAANRQEAILRKVFANGGAQARSLLDALSPEKRLAAIRTIIDGQEEATKAALERIGKKVDILNAKEEAGLQLAEENAIAKAKFAKEAADTELEQAIRTRNDLKAFNALSKEEQKELDLRIQAAQTARAKASINLREEEANKTINIEKRKNAEILAIEEAYQSAQLGNEFDNAEQIANLRAEQAKIEVSLIRNRLASLEKEGASKAVLDSIRNQIAAAEVVATAATNEVTNNALSKRVQLYKLASEKIQAEEQKNISVLEQQREALSTEEKILQLRTTEARETLDLEKERLEIQLKTTGDLVERAKINQGIVNADVESKIQAIESQKEAVKLQQQQNALSVERQLIENTIAEQQALVAQKELEFELAKAKLAERSPEQIALLEAQLDLRKQQTNALTAQRSNLLRNKDVEDQVAASTLRQLEARENLTKQGGIIDKEIAANEVVIAQLQKQVEQAKLREGEIQLAIDAQKEQLQLDDQRDQLLGNRVKLEQQARETNDDSYKKQLELFSQITSSGYERERIAILIAQHELDTLAKREAGEKRLLELQIKQQERALQRQEAELKGQFFATQAALASAKAEEAKVKARRDATEEEKRAAELATRAQEQALGTFAERFKIIEEERKANAENAKYQREEQRAQQENRRREAIVNLAATTPEGSKARQLVRDRFLSTFNDQIRNAPKSILERLNQFGFNEDNSRTPLAIPQVNVPLVDQEQTPNTVQELVARVEAQKEAARAQQLAQQAAGVTGQSTNALIAAANAASGSVIEVRDSELINIVSARNLTDGLGVNRNGQRQRGDNNVTAANSISAPIEINIQVSKEEIESSDGKALVDKLRSGALTAVYDVLKKTNIELGNY